MTFIVLVFSVLGYLLFLFVYSHMSSFFISFYGTSSHMYNRCGHAHWLSGTGCRALAVGH